MCWLQPMRHGVRGSIGSDIESGYMSELAQQLVVVALDQEVAQCHPHDEIGNVGGRCPRPRFPRPQFPRPSVQLFEQGDERHRHRVQGDLELVEHEQRLDHDQSPHRIVALEVDDELQRPVDTG